MSEDIMKSAQITFLVLICIAGLCTASCEDATEIPTSVSDTSRTTGTDSDQAPDTASPPPQDVGAATDVYVPINQPPAFGTDAAITILDLNATSARATWPAASDDAGVERYDVRVNGDLIEDIDATDLTATLQNLTPFTSSAVSVQAIDEDGGRSEPLVTTFQTSDNVPPSWPEPTTIVLTHVDETTASFTFSPATDNQALSGYRLYLDGQPIGGLETSTTILLEALSPLTSYSLTIWAEDVTGLSSIGPTIEWSTLDLLNLCFWAQRSR